jgi:hexosaminidase
MEFKIINRILYPGVFLLLALTSCGEQLKPVEKILPVIPYPQEVKVFEGMCHLGPGASDWILAYEKTGILPEAATGKIKLLTEKPDTKRISEYWLTIRRKGVEIRAADPSGWFYGLQTLQQMLGPEGSGKVPLADIHDFASFGWRGLMLDCSRTFLSKGYILSMIDRLADIRMNVLHLHLTDDQGWRIEIRKHPELTALCSSFDPKYPGEVNGFYTQENIREIVAYASKRHVTIVPEIEMPGHSSEIFAALPGLSCSGEKSEIFPFFKGPGVTEQILCAGNDSVFGLMEDVLSEVMDLFPSEYIHIGGDEAPKTAWKKCPECQKRIREEGLKDEAELQSYFIRRIEKYINSKGKKLIGWDEILEGGLAENAAVMSWRGIQGGIDAAMMGHPVVMSPTSHCYFDYSHETTPVEKVYQYHPVPEELSATQAHLILGAQANMWTHIARTPEAIDSQIFPRIYALAEVVWTNPEVRDFSHLDKRMKLISQSK